MSTVENNLQKREETRPVSTEGTRGGSALVAPAVDVIETADELAVVADLPGVTPEGLDVKFDNGVLTLYGRRHPWSEANARPLHMETLRPDFHRVFEIHEQIDAERISAELAHGVLTVRLPKAEAAKPRRIAVKAV